VDGFPGDFLYSLHLLYDIGQNAVVELVDIEEYIFAVEYLHPLLFPILEVHVAQFKVPAVADLHLFQFLLVMEDAAADVDDDLLLVQVGTVENLGKLQVYPQVEQGV
jgi:hypothetical protein